MLKKMKNLRKNGFRGQKRPKVDVSGVFKAKYESFKELLDSNGELSVIITDIEQKLQGREIFGMSYVRSQSARAVFHTMRMVRSLNALSSQSHAQLYGVVESIHSKIKEDLGTRREVSITDLTLPYTQITKEMVDWVGGKSANLGEVVSRAGLPAPDGFAITTRAFELFFESAEDLVEEINKRKLEIDPNDPETLNSASEEIQRLIILAPVPAELKDGILSAYDEMNERIRARGSSDDMRHVSLRSSAIGEDSDLSYAGQYLSLLNVPREQLVRTCTCILASLYTPRAISYRLCNGIKDEDIAMSVACLEMVRSVSSGVAYSRHPFDPLRDNIMINAVYGLGPYAVDGIVTPDTYVVAKDRGLTILDIRASHKPVQLVGNPEGGPIELPAPEEEQGLPCLSPEQIKQLAGYALTLEKHYGRPQDMEWALDEDGSLLVLQTRPLRADGRANMDCTARTPRLSQYPILVENGAVAFPGVGYGKAFGVHSEDDLNDFPDGGVLVARHSSPKYVVVMNRAQAIITDFGSVTGHMASLAREFGVPTILDAKAATELIPTGMEITVDAYSGRVYEGRVEELLSLRASR